MLCILPTEDYTAYIFTVSHTLLKPTLLVFWFLGIIFQAAKCRFTFDGKERLVRQSLMSAKEAALNKKQKLMFLLGKQSHQLLLEL